MIRMFRKRFKQLKQGPFDYIDTLRRYIYTAIKESGVPFSEAIASKAGIRGGGWTSYTYGAHIQGSFVRGRNPSVYKISMQRETHSINRPHNKEERDLESERMNRDLERIAIALDNRGIVYTTSFDELHIPVYDNIVEHHRWMYKLK